MSAGKKPAWPFMVFGESIPDAARLHDPNVTPEQKDAIRWKLQDDIAVVRAITERDTLRGRHAKNHEKRSAVMVGLQRDARGKPLRGEPKRLADLHGVSVAQVRKWIEQLKNAPRGGDAVPENWRAVYYGRALREQQRRIAKRPRKKPKG